MYSLLRPSRSVFSLPSELMLISEFPLVLNSEYSFVAIIDEEFKRIAINTDDENAPVFTNLLFKLSPLSNKIDTIKIRPISIIK